MTKARQQILDVMRIVSEQAKLNPDGAAFQLTTDHFSEYPDYKQLLEKLEKHGVIEIEQRPNENNLTDIKLGLLKEKTDDETYADYLSYHITLKQSFEALYKSEYIKHRSSISTLTDNNRELITTIMHAIDDEISLTEKTWLIIKMKPSQSGISNRNAFEFLKKVQAIDDYKVMLQTPNANDGGRDLETSENESYTVKINLPTFDEVLKELEDTTIVSRVLSSDEKRLSKNKLIKEPQLADVKVMFDDKIPALTFGTSSCDIPDESLEFYTCKLAFKNRRIAANEDDILEKSVKSQNSQRPVYDAMLRINKKAKADLGIEKLLIYRAAKIRINKKYQ